MPRPPNTQERRREIVQGLASVMAERGYARATIQEIARAAGLTPGLVHYHFETKHEILVALIESLAETVRTRVQADAAGPEARLYAAIDALVGTRAGIEARAVACWVVIGAEAVRDPSVRELYASLMRQLIAEFEGMLRARMGRQADAAARAAAGAVALVAAVEGFFRLSAGAPACVPAGSAAASIRAIADAFVRAPARSRP